MPTNVTVTAGPPYIQYVANGTQTEFPIPFALFSAANLQVFLDSVATVSGFTVKNLDTSMGVVVSFAAAPTAGTVITLRRHIVIQRTTGFQESGELRARTLNRELDYLTAALQQVEDAADRSVHLPPSDPTADLTLPTKTDRAGKALVFDTNGNVAVAPLATGTGIASLDEIPAGATNVHFTASDKQKLQGIAAGAEVNPTSLDELRDGKSRLAMTASERSKLQGIATGAEVNPASLDELADGNNRLAMSADERSKLQGIATGAEVNPASLDELADGNNRLAMSADERSKLQGIATGAEVNPASLDELCDGNSRLAMSADERSKLQGIATGAEVNPASLDELADGNSRLAMTASERSKLQGIATGAQVNPASLDELCDGNSRLAMTASERSKLQGIATGAEVNPASLDELADGNNRLAMSAEERSKLQGIATGAEVNPASLDELADGNNRLAMTASERSKLQGIATGAQVNPASLDELCDGNSRLAMTASERSKLQGIATGAEVNPASLDELADGNSRLAMSADERSKLQGIATGAEVNPASLDELADGNNRLAMTASERSKLQGIATGAQVNPASLDELCDGNSRLAMTASERSKLQGIATGAQVNPASLDELADGNSRLAMSADERSKLQGIATGAEVNPPNLDELRDGKSRLAMSVEERSKLQGIATGAEVNPPNLDELRDGKSRLAMSVEERSKLQGIATGAQVNPPAATDAEISTGAATATRTVSPAQIKAAVTTFAPVPSVAGRTGAITLSQTDVAGTVPTARKITVGSGLTGGGDLTADRAVAVNFATAGTTNGTATTVARADHSHTAATASTDGLLAAADKQKLDGIAAGAQVNTVASVAGRTGAVALSLADAADSTDGAGRYAMTTNETNLLRAFPQAAFAGRSNGAGSGALTSILPKDAMAMLPLATGSNDGIMPAAAKAKLDSIAAFPECNLGTFSTGNSAITLTDMAATVANPAIGNSAILGVSLKNTPLIYLRGTVATPAATTARIAVIFSPNTSTPYTWYMADGALAPANGSAAPSEPNGYCATDISFGGSAGFRTAVTVPAAIQALDTCSLQLIRWGGDGVADPSIINVRVSAAGNALSPALTSIFGRCGAITAAAGDYAANQILDAPDGSKVIMTCDEREIAAKATVVARSPLSFVRNRLRFNLTTDFGANNLTADATPTGSSGTDDRAKLKNIREYLRANYAGQEFDLLMPADRVAAISKTIAWDIDGAYFIGMGSPASTGFIGTYATYKHWNNSAFVCCSITNSNLSLRQAWRFASGVDGTADMKAGDTAFVASVTTDYDAINVGDKLTLLSGRYDAQADPVPTRRFTAKVIGKGAGGRIYLDRKLPFDFPSTPNPAKNSGAYNYKRADGTFVAGNVFAIHREMPSDGPQYSVDPVANEFHSKVSFINLLIASKAGFPTAGFPMDSLYQGCRIVGDGYGLYGNALQNTLVDGCEMETRAGICELGIGSCLNIIRNCVWIRSETYVSEMGSAWILRDGEYGCFNTFDNIELRGDNLTRTDYNDLAIIQALGTTGDKFRNIWARVAVPASMRAIYVTDYSDQPYGGCHNEFRNIYVESTATGATHGNAVIRFLGSGNSARQVQILSGAGSVYSNGPQIYAGSDDCDIMDFVVNPQQGNLPLTIQASCNRTRVTRYNGTVANSGTGSILTNNGLGTARLGRYF